MHCVVIKGLLAVWAQNGASQVPPHNEQVEKAIAVGSQKRFVDFQTLPVFSFSIPFITLKSRLFSIE
jgi:hypothetical protein